MSYEQVLEWLARGVDGIAVAIMVVGALLATFRTARATFAGSVQASIEIERARSGLGVRLLFALELMIVSDLIESVVSCDWNDLGFLGAIVVIRTLMGVFLGREMAELAESSENSDASA